MDMDGATDEALLHALPERIEALEVLYERYVRAAMGLAVRMVRDRETAEEVVQEAFLSLWRHAGRYEPTRGSVRTWLLGIVHHRAIDRLRGRPPTAPLPDELGPDHRTRCLGPGRAAARSRRDPRRPGAIACRAARGDRAGLFRGPDPDPDRHRARATAGHG